MTEPYVYEHRLATLALIAVYFTTVMSWVDWHPTMEANPYNMSSKNPHRSSEVVRLWCDLGVVTAYAYLLFTIDHFAVNPYGEVSPHLVGYPLIFLLYLLSGITRRRAYGKFASSIGTIAVFGALLMLVAGVHVAIDWDTADLPWVRDERLWGNVVGLLACFGLMVAFRYVRKKRRDARNRRKSGGLKIGFDVDGVLGNQIQEILPRIQRRHGITLHYEDVTDWRLPVGNSTIDIEIVAAMDDPDYILRMPVHAKAKDVLETLFTGNKILVLTARPEGTGESTEQWLINNALPFDQIFNVKEQKKSLFATDLLVDDYLGNVREYLRNTNGVAVLVDQPWNRDRDEELEGWIGEGRLRVVSSLDLVPPIAEALTRPGSTSL